MPGDDYFQFTRTRNFVTERLIDSVQQRQINCLAQRQACRLKSKCPPPCTSNPLVNYSTLYLDRSVSVEEDCPCIKGDFIKKELCKLNSYLKGETNNVPYRLSGGN